VKPAPFPHAETEIVATLGLARAVVRDVRSDHLTRGTHWQHVAGAVCYSDEGRTLLFNLLKAEPQKNSAEIGPAEIAPPAAPPPPAKQSLVCTRTPRNRRIVFAKLGGELMRVRVRDSANILPGMTLLCAHVQADLWELAQPLPRARGRW
jgi:hypothetical protein